MEPANTRKITTIHSNYTQQENDKMAVSVKKRVYLKRRLIALTIIMILFSVPMLVTMHKQNHKIIEMAQNKEQMEQQLALMKNDEVQLRQEVLRLNDINYIAELARRDLFLSSEGEKVFITPSPSN
jgi:cell division protein DivIC